MTDLGPVSAADALRALIRGEGGSISFEQFMQMALYHPRFGYYAKRVSTVGREGDFSTAATLHPALATAVAAWSASHRAEVAAQNGEWHLIELGGGNGEMAAQIMGALGWWVRRRLRYHVVEVSRGLQATQKQRLAAWLHHVAWHAEIPSALRAAKGRALIVSNEFVDAFPCWQLRWNGKDSGWQEVRVAWQKDASAPAEQLAAWTPPATAPLADASSVLEAEFAAGLPHGQRVEIHASYRRWLEGWSAHWIRGRMLTVDYGDCLPALYHRRPHGTMRAYCRQMRLSGAEIYQRVGQQDLTADVNFTDLQRWGEAAGLTTADYFTQEEFLRRWLSPAVVANARKEPALAYLLDPVGAGGAFKVLDQSR